MQNSKSNDQEQYVNPNEDSIVTDNLTGKRVDADPEKTSDQPADESNPVTQQSQKGKKVDGDPGKESDQRTRE